MREFGLGRREPSSFEHIARAPFKAAAPFVVEKSLILPSWHTKHNQGQQGACVGHGVSMMSAITNENQCRIQGDRTPYIRYNPWWMWDRAKEADEWPETNPGDDNGTSIKAACHILETVGHVDWPNEDDPKSIGPITKDFGIKEVKWATTVDDIRAAIVRGIPCAIACTWYTAFDTPEFINSEYWIGRGDFGRMDSGHCTCIYGASDQRQAFLIKNSWGTSYPEVRLGYDSADRLIRENGEVALITDL